jgi:hypothetical protein
MKNTLLVYKICLQKILLNGQLRAVHTLNVLLYKTLVSPLAIKIVHGRAKEFQFYATRLQNLRKIPHGKQNYQSDFENSETLY